MISEQFFPFCGLPFHFVDCVLCCTEVLHFDVVEFIYFCFSCLCFGVIAKKSLINLTSWSFSSMFSYKVFDPLWVNFCVWCKIRVQVHSFACGYPFFPAPFAEQTVLFLEWVAPLLKTIWPYLWWFISWLSSTLLVYVFVFMPVPH